MFLRDLRYYLIIGSQVMYAKYEANLNIDGTGAIVAAPDLETPGERKIYLWRTIVK